MRIALFSDGFKNIVFGVLTSVYKKIKELLRIYRFENNYLNIKKETANK